MIYLLLLVPLIILYLYLVYNIEYPDDEEEIKQKSLTSINPGKGKRGIKDVKENRVKERHNNKKRTKKPKKRSKE